MRVAGGSRSTRREVAAACDCEPDVPVTVSDSAYGLVLVDVFMVSVDVPAPVMSGGLNPPLVMPGGKPASEPASSVTVPLNPVSGVTVTVNVADWPGTTAAQGGLTSISKS